jgi:hypothetical protein
MAPEIHHGARDVINRTPPKAEPGREDADELLGERIVEEAGKAIRDHKRTGIRSRSGKTGVWC